MYFLTLHNLGN